MGRSLEDPRYRAVVARLVEMRISAGLTQRALADRLSRTRSYVSRVETCELRLDIVQLLDWLKVLGQDQQTSLLNLVRAIEL